MFIIFVFQFMLTLELCQLIQLLWPLHSVLPQVPPEPGKLKCHKSLAAILTGISNRNWIFLTRTVTGWWSCVVGWGGVTGYIQPQSCSGTNPQLLFNTANFTELP